MKQLVVWVAMVAVCRGMPVDTAKEPVVEGEAAVKPQVPLVPSVVAVESDIVEETKPIIPTVENKEIIAPVEAIDAVKAEVPEKQQEEEVKHVDQDTPQVQSEAQDSVKSQPTDAVVSGTPEVAATPVQTPNKEQDVKHYVAITSESQPAEPVQDNKEIVSVESTVISEQKAEAPTEIANQAVKEEVQPTTINEMKDTVAEKVEPVETSETSKADVTTIPTEDVKQETIQAVQPETPLQEEKKIVDHVPTDVVEPKPVQEKKKEDKIVIEKKDTAEDKVKEEKAEVKNEVKPEETKSELVEKKEEEERTRRGPTKEKEEKNEELVKREDKVGKNEETGPKYSEKQ